MNKAIENILAELKIHPVLIDIGASGEPPAQWDTIAKRSIYVGFDPDRREICDLPDGRYARSIIVNEALTSLPGKNEARFYLARSPHCSSTLLPDAESLSHYIFSDLFEVEKEVSVPASSLNTVIDRLGLNNIDWFKTDSQGTDLRLFQSLRDEMRDRVLAVDVEPGLIDAYAGEDLFVDTHRELLRQGFWLSSLDIKGSVRMSRAVMKMAAGKYPGLKDPGVFESVRQSPCWCEGRYFRTLESLGKRGADKRDYALLWVFSMIERQWGYAFETGVEYGRLFGDDKISRSLLDAPIRQLKRNPLITAWRAFKAMVPDPLKKLIKNSL